MKKLLISGVCLILLSMLVLSSLLSVKASGGPSGNTTPNTTFNKGGQPSGYYGPHGRYYNPPTENNSDSSDEDSTYVCGPQGARCPKVKSQASDSKDVHVGPQ